MQLAFVQTINQAPEQGATACHAALPRSARKTLRLHTPRTTPNTFSGVDHYFLTEYREDKIHTQNLEYLDRGYDFDEFGDIDDEYEGLTITEPMNEEQLFHFCTGYDIL